MTEIYINKEAMERARSKHEKDIEKFFGWFLWFIVGIVAGYAWFWMQGAE